MAKEIKELTNIMIEEQEFDSQSDRWKAEIDAAYIALENQCYKQAWDHFYKVHSLTFSESKLAKEREHDFYYFKGEASHGLCKVVQEIPNDDEFVKYLIETDRDLIRKSKSKNVSGRYARSFIGRKYLKYAADDCGYYPAMIEYALNCVGSGHKKSFVFEYNDRDAQVGLQWANRILLSSFKEHKAHGYAIYAKYYFARYSASKSQDDLLKFCDNVMSAIENDNSKKDKEVIISIPKKIQMKSTGLQLRLHTVPFK